MTQRTTAAILFGSRHATRWERAATATCSMQMTLEWTRRWRDAAQLFASMRNIQKRV
jgi:hypothetical protein